MAEWIVTPGAEVLVVFVFLVATALVQERIILAVWKGVRFFQRLWERVMRGRLDSQQARQEVREVREVREDMQRLEEQLQEIKEALRRLK